MQDSPDVFDLLQFADGVFDPTNLIVRLAMMLFSTGLIAFGLFWYVPADIIPLAGEGAMLAISKTIKKPFPTVKIAFDVTMVVISLVTCLSLILSAVSASVSIAAAILSAWSCAGLQKNAVHKETRFSVLRKKKQRSRRCLPS